MPTHEASAQMLGYLYQVRYALFLLLSTENPNAKICIEKFDDISFEENGTPTELIQTKHHINALGNLTDKSMDLWKTIKVWLDLLDEAPELIDSCRFMIVTCSKTPENSAASFLKRANRDEETAYRLLKKVADSAGNKGLEKEYKKFQDTNKDIIINLLKRCEIVDGEPIITDLKKSMLPYIRSSCDTGFDRKVLEKVEGWWFQRVIEQLTSPEKPTIEYNELLVNVRENGRKYTSDNLPIGEWVIADKSEEEINKDESVFVQQLRLINASNKKINRAIKNHYRASMQRSEWTREYLVGSIELQNYDDELKDEWEEARSYFEGGDPVAFGKSLYETLMNKDIRIRERCTDSFVMRGSYQILSDKKEIGWHMDYIEKLKD